MLEILIAGTTMRPRFRATMLYPSNMRWCGGISANHNVENLKCLHSHSSRPEWHSAPTIGKKIQQRRTKHGPRPSSPHWHEPTQHIHYIVIEIQENTCYIHGFLPSAHTPTDFV